MLEKYIEHVTSKMAERTVYQEQQKTLKEKIELQEQHYTNLLKARLLVAEVARMTQTNFTTYVEELVTMAIQSIFDRPFKFKVNFDLKRNKSECFLRIQEGEDEEPFVPKDELGGGMLDTISFALRIVLWSLQKPRSSNTILLDEPFKFVGQDELLDRAGQMLKEISHKMGLQFIITTHQPRLAEIADKAWKVEHNGKYSITTQLTPELPKSRLLRKK